jgi:uncharacterized OB-fold protein
MTAIVASVCKACGAVAYPRRKCCKCCGKKELKNIPLEGRARLLTFTRVYNLSLAFEERYLTLGIVEFENGARALGRLDVDEPEIGMNLAPYVAPVRTEGYRTYSGLWFRKA